MTLLRLAALIAVTLAAGCRSEPQPATANGSRPATAAAASVHPVSGLPLVPLEIRAGSRVYRFTVEVAATPDQQSYGLMYRNSIGANEGMIFPFKPPRPASFWMKNTFIPLDLVFIRANGTIARIAANAKPQSLDTIEVGEPVAAVLEIKGGRAAELGITEAARVSWPGGPGA